MDLDPILVWQAELRKSLSLIPLVVYQAWRGAEISDYVDLLVRKTRPTKTNQNLRHRVAEKPLFRISELTCAEFKAFWLRSAKPLTPWMRRHVADAGVQDLASWTHAGNTDPDNEWDSMAPADKDAKAQLSEAQYTWRQRLLLVEVREIIEDTSGNWVMKLDMEMPIHTGTGCEKFVTTKMEKWKDDIARAAAPSASKPKTNRRPPLRLKSAAPPAPQPTQPAPQPTQAGDTPGDDENLTLEDVVEAMANMQTALQGEIAGLREERSRDHRELEALREGRNRDRHEVEELRARVAELEGTGKRKRAGEENDERRAKARRFIQGLKGG